MGKGLYNPGAPSYAELVTREMYCADPELFCWIARDTCPNGMTLAFWMQYKGSDSKNPCVINSAQFPSSIDTGILSNGFGIFYFTAVPKLFVFLMGNVTNGKNYYETDVPVSLEPDTWHHVTMSFSHTNGLRLCEGGAKVIFTMIIVEINATVNFLDMKVFQSWAEMLSFLTTSLCNLLMIQFSKFKIHYYH